MQVLYKCGFFLEGVGDLTGIAYLAYVVRRKDKEKTTTSTTTIKIRTQTSWVSVDMDDGINEQGPAVSVCTNKYIL